MLCDGGLKNCFVVAITTLRRLIFEQINLRNINFPVDLFSRMQILPAFAWIYFRGFSWTYFRDCKIYHAYV